VDFKHLASRIISVVLIGAGLYKVFYSALLIFFIYPRFNIQNNTAGLLIQQGLVEKALVYWLTMVVDGLFGFNLLFKPQGEIRFVHIFLGLFISIFSVFFIVRTPLTVNPLLPLIQSLFGQ